MSAAGKHENEYVKFRSSHWSLYDGGNWFSVASSHSTTYWGLAFFPINSITDAGPAGTGDLRKFGSRDARFDADRIALERTPFFRAVFFFAMNNLPAG